MVDCSHGHPYKWTDRDHRERRYQVKSELEQIPGIDANMASHLIDAGFPTIAALPGKRNWWDWKD